MGSGDEEHKENLTAFHAALAEPMGFQRWHLMTSLYTKYIQKFQ